MRFGWAGFAVGLGAIAMLAAIPLAPAQEHRHPPQDELLHYQFYSTWLIPNSGAPRVSSCCSKKDCYPTQVKKRGNAWYALRREDAAWIRIPDSIIEQNQMDPRESPDESSHVCMAPPTSGDFVYCAVLGSGF